MAIDLNDPETKKAIEEGVKTGLDAAVEKAVEVAVAGLKAKNDELLGKLKEGKVSEGDRAELEKFRKSKTKKEEDESLKAGEYGKLKEQLVKKHGEDMLEMEAKNKKMKQALDKHLIDAAAISAIASAKGLTKLLLPHVKTNLKVIEDDGEFVARVVDSAGTVRIGDDKGNPMTIEQLVASMKTDEIFSSAFEGTGVNGGGAHGSDKTPGKKKTMSRSNFDKMEVLDKNKFMNEGGALTDG